MRNRNLAALITVLACTVSAHAQSEACCLQGGACINITAEFCTLLFMGLPQGPGTSCEEGGCVGACFVDGVCSDDVNIYDCEAQGGSYQGGGSTCADATGACCIDFLDCVQSASEEDCTAKGGAWYGLGVTCDQVENCDGSLGACCLIDGCVGAVDEDECRFGLRGSWQGPLSACGNCPPIGACCVKETAECFDGTSEDDCEGGKFGTGRFQGKGTTCNDVSCPVFGFGACCLPDGQCWEGVEESKCRFQLDGTYVGDNIPCDEVDCPCPADVSGDSRVAIEDLLALLVAWGSYDCPPFRPEDINTDCVVSFGDLIIILSAWGPCM